MNPFLIVIPGVLGAIIATSLFLYGIVELVRRKGPRAASLAHDFLRGQHPPFSLRRAKKNPLIVPGAHAWEAEAVMNPGAVRVNDRTHLFYRAVGTDGASRIGYASSKDGLTFDDRLPHPVFALSERDPRKEALMRRYNPLLYPGLLASGGTWSGTEDPRAVLIDDRLYLTFSAFEGWHSLRIGVSSLSLSDLEAKRWNWTKPVFLSKPGEVHKNWVLFPKKIHGKFALLHGFVSGDRGQAQIAYLDTLDAPPPGFVESDARFRDDRDFSAWDSQVRGAAAPPIETEAGWLVLYHATDAKDPNRYKVGALLLDHEHPEQVIARAPVPLLEPDAAYENDGAKAGVVYACGATVEGDTLTVYYGGADSRICAAATSLSALVAELVKSRG